MKVGMNKLIHEKGHYTSAYSVKNGSKTRIRQREQRRCAVRVHLLWQTQRHILRTGMACREGCLDEVENDGFEDETSEWFDRCI